MGLPTEKDMVGTDRVAPLSSDGDVKEVILRELERILVSRSFRNSARSREFLSYIVHNSLAGHPENLKERIIGSKIFHRAQDYPTGDDPVVRVHAGEVRRRLEQYYSDFPNDTPVRIGIPVGSYAPEFKWTSNAAADESPQSPAMLNGGEPTADNHESQGEHQVATDVFPSEAPATMPRAPQAVVQDPRKHTGLVVAAVIIIALALSNVFLWFQLKTLNRSLNPWQYEPAVKALWSNFLTGRQTDLVMEDQSYLLIQSITKEKIPLNDYLNHTFLMQLRDPKLDQQTRNALDLIESKSLARTTDSLVVRNVLALAPLEKNIQFYYAREFTADYAEKDNVIVLGPRMTNPWAELFDKYTNFTADSSDMLTLIHNRNPVAGEQQVYTPIDTPNQNVEYCAVAYLPKPDNSGRLLLIQGTNGVATLAGLEFLLSEDEMSAFQNKIHRADFPYFEILLKTSDVSLTPFATTIAAYRTYPDLR